MKTLFNIGLISILLFSCMKEVDIAVPVMASQVVVDAKIYGGDSVLAFLSTSEYYLSDSTTDFGRDTNYEVFLFRNDVFVEKLRPVRGGSIYYRNYFTGDHAPEVGGSYSIRASRENLKPAKGSSIVPDKVTIRQVDWDTTELGMVVMEVTFQDPPTTSNHYLLTSTISNDSGFQNIVTFRTLDPHLRTFRYGGLLQVENEGQFSKHFFISDDSFNGKEKTLRLELLRFSSDTWPRDLEGIEVKLYHISPDWYLHEESKFNFYKTQLGVFAEPSRIHSNIDGGLGIVGSASEDRFFLNF